MSQFAVFEKEEIESFKQKMELFLPLPVKKLLIQNVSPLSQGFQNKSL